MPTSSRPLMIAVIVATSSMSVARAQTPIPPSTKNFVAAAAQSDHFEIAEARTALAQTHDPRIRAFAQDMIRDHSQTSEGLQSAALKAGVPTPVGLDGDQQKLLAALQAQRGADFNRLYMKQQVMAHQEALTLEQSYAAKGENPDVQQAARSAVPIIQRHLAMAKQLRAGLGEN